MRRTSNHSQQGLLHEEVLNLTQEDAKGHFIIHHYGLSVKKAFEQAKGVMMLESPTEANTPMLYTKDEIDVDTLFFVRPVS